jgi:aminoglycoside phosphotransferase (APT) family kinase protein
MSNADFGWVESLLAPGAPVHGTGNYNRNLVVEHDRVLVVVRIPIPDAAPLDLRVLAESDVLRLLAAQVFPAPRLLHVDPARRFVVHSFVPGQRLDDLFPVRAPLPDWVADDLAGQLAALHRLDPSPLAERSAATVGDGGGDLLRASVAFTTASYAQLKTRHAWLYEQLRVPADPLSLLLARVETLGRPPPVLCHSDVHRRNLIAVPDAERLTIIDWELALVGDAAFDLAVHFHRMRYSEAQERRFLTRYLQLRGELEQNVMLAARIDIYRQHEQVRSALIDVARTVEDMREPLPPATRLMLATHYGIKLRRACQIWGLPEDTALTDEALLTLLDEAARRGTEEDSTPVAL